MSAVSHHAWYHLRWIHIPGKILTLGGAHNYDNGFATARADVFDLNNGNAVGVRRVGNLQFARAFCNSVVLPSGEVVVVGGQQQVELFNDSNAVFAAEIWNPSTEQFRTIELAAVPRTYHSVAILMKDGRVWVGGGGLCGNCPFNHPDAEILTPPYLRDANGNTAQRPVITSATANTRPGGAITVVVDSVENHTFALVRMSAVTHSVNNDGRRFPLTVLQKSGASFSLGIPNSPAVALPGRYFLFAMNTAGVPSVASVLRINP